MCIRDSPIDEVFEGGTVGNSKSSLEKLSARTLVFAWLFEGVPGKGGKLFLNIGDSGASIVRSAHVRDELRGGKGSRCVHDGHLLVCEPRKLNFIWLPKKSFFVFCIVFVFFWYFLMFLVFYIYLNGGIPRTTYMLTLPGRSEVG